MKILFICGSLEYGKDGVGDYTRRLAGEIIRQGHSAAIIALNDRHISAVEQTEQETDCTKISVLRLPSVLTNKEKYNKAEEYIKDFDPEWLSLQFVPYSFNKKGLPFGLGKRLSKIGKGRKWHVMFHELWVGMDKESSLKLFLTGKMQEKIIKKIVLYLSPIFTHTQTKLYQIQLQKAGIKSNILPLFGNIPIELTTHTKDTNYITLVLFGGIQQNAPIQNFAKYLFDYQINNKQKIRMFFIGHSGMELDKWLCILKEYPFDIQILGEQDTKKISKIFNISDWGISTTPLFQIEKSGCVASMREHNLPILCVARKWTPRDTTISFTHNVCEWRPDLKFTEILKQTIESNSLQKVTKQFISDISCCK